jgi:molybdopterin molybdotransferase
MITLQQALKIVLDKAVLKPTEVIAYNQSLNHVLAEDIFSDINMPPFDKSAMDGFACRMEDIKKDLKVVEVIAAGDVPQRKIENGQCAKIMTGAKIPEGSDCVLMVEQTEEVSENIIRFVKDKTKANICYLGEDVKKGEKVLSNGTLIQPQHIAIISSVGATKVQVYQKPQVGVISTGDEIVEPGEPLKETQIRNSNGHQIMAQLAKIGIDGNYYGIAEDKEESTYQKISTALAENDIVILSGGVSMGDFDHVPKVFKKLGVELHFEKIAVKPGKPTTFGTLENKMVFGLPGNPVSSFMQFELVVKPVVFELMGHHYVPPKISLPMAKSHFQKKADREFWFPVKLSDDGKIMPLDYHGSAHIYALDEAWGICAIPQGVHELKEGERVDVRPI